MLLSILLQLTLKEDERAIAELTGKWILYESRDNLKLEQMFELWEIPGKLFRIGPVARRALLRLPESQSASSSAQALYSKWKAVLAGGDEEARLMLTYSRSACNLEILPRSMRDEIKAKLGKGGRFSRELLEFISK